MDLWKTTILPTDDAQLAQRVLRDLIYEEPLVLLVVLGTGEEANTFVERASRNAGARNEPWWVVWARKPKAMQPVLDDLTGKKLGDVDKLRGFTLSMSDRVVDTFLLSDPVPDQLAILTAFMRSAAEDGVA